MTRALLDTDTLSEFFKGRDPDLRQKALDYLQQHRRLIFSLITRYEILRGLKAKQASQQLVRFEALCRASTVLPLTDRIIVRAADLYADLKQRGQLISDADLLIAATALHHGLTLITHNTAHYSRIPGLALDDWKT
jgi:tRNA(fMet)-specific endonuclease VapC